MIAPGHRHERIAGEIQQEISLMLAGELKDPRLLSPATVTQVHVSPNLKQVRVYVNVMGTETEQMSTLQGLVAASGFIRHELCERLQLRRTPELNFVLDRYAEYGQRIEELIRHIKTTG